MPMQWVMLGLAGVLEIGWAISLKLTDGWTKFGFLALNVAFGLGAAYSLAQALKAIPLATAYIIWKGIAILGLIVYEIWYEKQPFQAAKLVFALLIIVGIVGLKSITPATAR